jgi:hypothetical protein
VNPVEQLTGRLELESPGQLDKRIQLGVALTALEQADLGAIEIAHLAQFLLSEAGSVAMNAEVEAKLLAYFLHAVQPPA